MRAGAERSRGVLPLPVRFLCGNPHDAARIRAVVAARPEAASVDPNGVFAYLGDGSVLAAAGLRIGGAGGADLYPDARPEDVAPAACSRLRAQGPVDILLTHDGRAGFSWPPPDGSAPGSARIAEYALAAGCVQGVRTWL